MERSQRHRAASRYFHVSWPAQNGTESRLTFGSGNAHVTRGARIIASTNLSVGGFDLVTITDERLGTSERHYTLEFDEAKNYEIPIRFLSANTVVIGSSRGVVEIVNVESEDRAVLAHGELVAVTTLSEKLNVEIDGGQLVNVLDVRTTHKSYAKRLLMYGFP